MQYRSHRAYPVAGVLGLVVVALLAQFAVEWLSNQVVASGFPAWLPQFATAAQTLYVYNLGAAVVSYVLVPVLIFVVGYQYGKARS